MLDTLKPGELVFCARPDFNRQPPQRGDIVLFYADNRERGNLWWNSACGLWTWRTTGDR
jgi:hypothetical protein